MTLEEIKNLSHKDKDDLQNELWEIIKADDLSKLKQFLQYFDDVQQLFYSPNFDNEEEPIFNAAITLRNACLVCDRTKDFQILELLLQYGLKAMTMMAITMPCNIMSVWVGRIRTLSPFCLREGQSLKAMARTAGIFCIVVPISKK